MGDELGDEWWTQESNADAAEAVEEKQPAENPSAKAEKRKGTPEDTVEAKMKKNNEQSESPIPPKTETEDEQSAKPKKKRKRKKKKKKKTITDVLATSEPKPGCPDDLQDLVKLYFSDKRSVIELEELKLENSCFLSSNDLTHTISSYLKEICPKWAKIQKEHTEKSSVVILIVCSSALRVIELIKQMATFKGEAKVVKLFGKHIKMQEQVKLLQKGVAHIGVGTPGRICALIENEGLNLQALKYLVLDWNWRDPKLRRMVDIPEIKLDFMNLLEKKILAACKEDKVKIGLF